MLKAIKRKIAKVEGDYSKQRQIDKDLSFFEWSQKEENSKDTAITVMQHDFIEVLKEIKPSVSEQDLQKYKSLRMQFEN